MSGGPKSYKKDAFLVVVRDFYHPAKAVNDIESEQVPGLRLDQFFVTQKKSNFTTPDCADKCRKYPLHSKKI